MRGVAVAVLLGCGLTAGGCVGRDGDADYAAAANAICEEVVRELPAPSSIQPGARANDALLRQLAAARRKAIGRLAALAPPATQRELAAAMVRHLQKSQRLLDIGVSERERQTEGAVPAFIAAAVADDRAHQAARDLGAPACGRL